MLASWELTFSTSTFLVKLYRNQICTPFLKIKIRLYFVADPKTKNIFFLFACVLLSNYRPDFDKI